MSADRQPTSAPHPQVDHSALRTNQALIIGLIISSFVLDAPHLVAFVAAVLIVSALRPRWGLFTGFYRHVLKPAGLVKPDVIEDHPEPHRFSQSLGGAVTALATLAHLAGLAVLGWGLAGVVVLLASLNLFAGWCAGCTLYYWLNRAGVPGFEHSRGELAGEY